MRTLEQTTDEILDLAAMHFKVARADLHAGDDFYKKLGIDSLQALELLQGGAFGEGVFVEDGLHDLTLASSL